MRLHHRRPARKPGPAEGGSGAEEADQPVGAAEPVR